MTIAKMEVISKGENTMGLIILGFLSLFSFGMWKLYRWNAYNAKLFAPYQEPDKENSAVSSTTVVRTQIY